MLTEDRLIKALTGALEYDKRSIARLITVFEQPGEAAGQQRKRVLASLNESGADAKGVIVGITGTPGAGKSSLINELCLGLIKADPALRVAVVAVDPSSQISGGSILGDRTRTRFPADENRLFFRSQPTQLELGGITQNTFQAVRLLRCLFDLVIVETVGIGQNELTVGDLAEHVYLLLQPLGGDQVQFLKSGIMELPDHFIVNKCDAEVLARQTVNMLNAGLKAAAITSTDGRDKQVFPTSVVTGEGIDDLIRHLLDISLLDGDFSGAADAYLKRWVAEEYGRFGSAIYSAEQAEARRSDDHAGQERSQKTNQRAIVDIAVNDIEGRQQAFLAAIADNFLSAQRR